MTSLRRTATAKSSTSEQRVRRAETALALASSLLRHWWIVPAAWLAYTLWILSPLAG